jgi:hypothetical protein
MTRTRSIHISQVHAGTVVRHDGQARTVATPIEPIEAGPGCAAKVTFTDGTVAVLRDLVTVQR